MPIALGVLVLLATVVLMEAVAYALHRWVMHGRLGWLLHRSHHAPRTGPFEGNDWYAVLFAAPSVLLFALDVPAWARWVGGGIAVYGLLYFVFHDVLVHQRVPLRFVARSTYLKRIVQAHRLHHAVEAREGGVSFGFLYAPRPETLKAELKTRGRAGLRAPAGE